MSPTRVALHIGAMKTGTTFVQRMLGTNRQLLADRGILYPTPWSDQVEAVRDVLALKGGSHLGSIDGSWQRLIGQLKSWDGPAAVLSVEFISFADATQIQQMLGDLTEFDVSVILGARDLGRVLPAQWQTAVRNGQTTTYREYLSGVTMRRPSRAKRHFWKRQDIGEIGARWAKELGPRAVQVVTVPPSGSDPNELWRRMAVALDLTNVSLESHESNNESLGATGTELLRRVNQQAADRELAQWNYQHGVNRALSHRVLPNLPDARSSMVLPTEQQAWASKEAQRIVREIRESGVNVVGDLDDLLPKFKAGARVEWPEDIPDSDLLTLSTAALAGLADQFAELKKEGLGQGPGRKRKRRDGAAAGNADREDTPSD